MQNTFIVPKWLSILCLIIILFCGNIRLFSQNNGLLYYQQRNKASLYIIKNEYSTALSIYNDILQTYDYPYVHDVIDAIYCATLCKDSAQMYKYLRVAIGRGIELHGFEKQKIFKKYLNDFQWKKLREDEISLLGNYQHNLDSNLVKKLIELKTRDQATRITYPNQNEQWNHIDSINSVEMSKIIQSSTFPNEKIVGIYKGLSPITLVLRHTIFLPNYNDKVHTRLLESVKNLQYNNHDYAWIMERTNICYGVEIGFNRNKITQEPPCILNNREQVNNRRKEIGLCTYEEEKRLIQYKNPKAYFYLGIR